MNKLWWRIRFTLATSWILRDFWSFRRLYISLGWTVSRTVNKNLPPYQTALDEITRWYTE